MKKIIIPVFITAMLLVSCELLEETTGLTEEEIIEGLKTALNVGSDSASTNLSVINGYYGNPLVKIPLPQEVESIRNKINGNTTLALISKTVELEDIFEDVVLAVNRSAEDAAREAAPIFKNAITGLTISQGWDILHGKVPAKSTGVEDFDSTAATKYLSKQTYDPLTDLYAPKINTALDKDLVGGYSATETWESLTTTYNNFMSSSEVQLAIQLAIIAGKNPNLPAAIETDIGVFSTQKALDGLFLMVGKEETKIRRDPWAWATTAVGNILEKVFGSVD
ncbi:MAG: DUF4197 domain-containing protein [Bacteroidales bacterium]|nr:DUF4197 domain-containing protein [Bacteroidales bacterium]